MRIGIIGAGVSGLVASWLLHEAHEVVLFERNDYLGGHAHTLTVEHAGRSVAVDTAFQHFSHQLYPTFVRLLELLGVRLRRVPVSATFHSKGTARVKGKARGGSLLMPPPLTLHDLRPTALATLLQLRHAIGTAAELDTTDDWSTTVGEFVDGLRVTPSFKSEFLYPFVTALLGTSMPESRRMSARAALRYPVHHQPASPLRPFEFLEVEGGVESYIRTLGAQLGQAEVRLGARIESVRREGVRYLVQEGGSTHVFDQLIVATPARDAATLLRGLPGSETLQETLASIEYIETRIAVHSDPSWLPPQRSTWSACNMTYDGQTCEFSMWPGRHAGVDVFKSWVTHQHTTPQSLHRLYRYFHPLMTPDYFRAQTRLARHQGQAGLWLAGSYTQDIDSHESGVRSAIAVAEQLLPQSNFFRLATPENTPGHRAS
jgi:predicted NAD/FAD-binding protein